MLKDDIVMKIKYPEEAVNAEKERWREKKNVFKFYAGNFEKKFSFVRFGL